VIPDPSPPFECDLPPALTDRIRSWHELAARLGRGPEVARAFAHMIQRLRTDPREWGDPVRDYRHAQLTEYHASHWKFRCKYAVHARVPIVFLLDLWPLECNPLFGTDLSDG
jgi:hypothetical protein